MAFMEEWWLLTVVTKGGAELSIWGRGEEGKADFEVAAEQLLLMTPFDRVVEVEGFEKTPIVGKKILKVRPSNVAAVGLSEYTQIVTAIVSQNSLEKIAATGVV